MSLELTEQEGQVLVGLLNEANKSKGFELVAPELTYAEAALFFMKKVREGFLKDKQEKQIPQTENS